MCFVVSAVENNESRRESAESKEYLVPTWGRSQANDWETMCIAHWEHNKTSMARAGGTSGE